MTLVDRSMLAATAEADDCRSGATAGRPIDVFANSGQRAGSIDSTLTPISPPIFSPEPLVVPDPFDPANFPAAFPINCGGQSMSGGERETFTLTPGTYNAINVGLGGKVILSPGTYNFCSLRAIHTAGIEITAPATINIQGQIHRGLQRDR